MAKHIFENNQKKSNVTGQGGARKGAGRKPGSANIKTREIADKAAESGRMPLEVMLDTMRKLYDEGDMIGAANIARHAAPYCHPRLASIEHTGNDGSSLIPTHGVLVVPAVMSEAEWESQTNGSD